jgi:OmpA-OmpF porin, OOP family
MSNIRKTKINVRYEKRSISCILFLSIIFQLNAQNLVPNSSFEEYINFDTAKFKGWHKAQDSDTPDYINLGNNVPCNNIFSEFIGGTKPRSGDGYAGIFCYRVHPDRNIKNIREYIETPLINVLERDSLYKVEISLCLDAESNIAIRNFGLLFSQVPLQFNKDFKMFSQKPQLEFNSTYLDSTRSWITLQSFYKAEGFEKYLILGNFKADKSTTKKSNLSAKVKGKKSKWSLTPKESAAYYYIDDVVVEKVAFVENPTVVIQENEKESKDTFNINEIKVDSAVVLKNILFEFNKSDLLPLSYDEINKLYHLMIAHPEIRIKLEGHTDNVGGYDFNLQLSLKRVESVVRYLIEKGINPERIEFAGYSYSYPLASNQTEEGRKINRRVAFKIIEKN